MDKIQTTETGKPKYGSKIYHSHYGFGIMKVLPTFGNMQVSGISHSCVTVTEEQYLKNITMTDKLKTTDCYVPVKNMSHPVKYKGQRLDNNEWVTGSLIQKSMRYGSQYSILVLQEDEEGSDIEHLVYYPTVEICLEKKEGVIVLTEAEFEKEVSERVQSALSLLNAKPQSLPNI